MESVSDDDWDELPSQPVKSMKPISDDWDELPSKPVKKLESIDDDWNDTPSKSKSKKEPIDDDWDELPSEPIKKPLSDDDWNDPPSKPTRRQSTASAIHSRKVSKPVVSSSNSDWGTDDDLPVETKKEESPDISGFSFKPATTPVSETIVEPKVGMMLSTHF